MPARRLHPCRVALLLLPSAIVAMGLASAASARAKPDTAAASPSPPAKCWSVTGPLHDGRETYFDAVNGCAEAYHCLVWVNSHEPPYSVHLEPRSSGRIDVGGSAPDDKYSRDCVPVGLRGERG